MSSAYKEIRHKKSKPLRSHVQRDLGRGMETLESRRLLTMLAAVSNTDRHPHRAAVQLNAVWDDGDNVLERTDRRNTCSGAMVSEQHVLTAGHCLYNSDRGGYADWVFVHAGRNGEHDRPYGEASATEWIVPSGYQNGNDAFDIGVVALDRSLGNATGHFGMRTFNNLFTPARPLPGSVHGLPVTDPIAVIHYPAEFSFNGNSLDGHDQYISTARLNVVPIWNSVLDRYNDQLVLPVDMNLMWTAGGSSGAPLYLSDTNQIIGVLKSGDEVPPGSDGTDNYVLLNETLGTTYNWVNRQVNNIGRTPVNRPIFVDHDQWFDDSDSSISDSSPNTGDTIRVNAKIFNAGTTSANNVRVRFRLSNNDQYDANTDDFLGDAIIPSIPAFASRTATFSTQLPQVAPGGHHIVWTVDPNNDIREFDADFHDVIIERQPRGDHVHGSLRIQVSDDSNEPDDSRFSATALPSGRWLSSISGRGVQYDDDWYRITVPSGRPRVKVDLRFTDSDGDIDLQLRDSSGSVLDRSASTDDNEEIDFVVPSGGDYYLRVYYDNHGNTYDLRWEGEATADLVGVEFNAVGNTAFAGSEIDLRFKVENQSNGNADSFVVRFYISHDANISTADRSLGTFRIDSLASGATTSRLSRSVRLPSGGDSFWSGDGEYFIGMIVDVDDDIPENDESNNSNQGGGADSDSMQITVFRPGTFQVVETFQDEIQLPQFDASMGQLEQVIVQVAPLPGVTDSAVGLALLPHVIVVQAGPFTFVGNAFPAGGPNNILVPHTHPYFIPPVVLDFDENNQLLPFVDGRQSWSLTNLTTDSGPGHAHTLSDVTFQVITTFFFDPPDPDLAAVSFQVLNADPLQGREAFEVQYEVTNLGEGPATDFEVGFYMSTDPIITTDDVRLGRSRIEEPLLQGDVLSRTRSLSMPHPDTNRWEGDGVYYIGIILDPDSEIDEVNETNNANLGPGIDHQPKQVLVNPPGTISHLTSGDINSIQLPQFDSSLGRLTEAVVSLRYLNGVTDSVPTNCPNCFHDHVFQFEVAEFQLSAYALPSPAFVHQVIPLQAESKYTYSGDELLRFESVQNLIVPEIVSSVSIGHSHRLAAAAFLVDTIFYFENDPGDFNNDGTVNPADVDLICRHLENQDSAADLNSDGQLDNADLVFLVKTIMGTSFGDANADGIFDTADLIAIFQSGKYEDGIDGNSTWAEGDWNCDGDFDSSDLIVAFGDGGYAVDANRENAIARDLFSMPNSPTIEVARRRSPFH